MIQRYIDAAEITGAITMVSRRGKIAHFERRARWISRRSADAQGRLLPHRVDVEADHRRWRS
jgi:hypothetical protein